MAYPKVDKNNDLDLLNRFNKRDIIAFGAIYSKYYDDLYYYSLKLYRNSNTEPEDAVHDAVVHLWQSKDTFFEQLIDIKAYLFVCIRNNFNHLIRRDVTTQKYLQQTKEYDDMIEADIIESEVMAALNHELNLLPTDSAKIMRLFLDGFSTEDVVERINLSMRTVYNKKNMAVSHLRKKLSKDKIFLFLVSIQWI